MSVDITDWTVPEIILWRRAKLGLTQAQLAEGICHVRTIHNIETGKYNPSGRIRILLEERLKLPPNALLSQN